MVFIDYAFGTLPYVMMVWGEEVHQTPTNPRGGLKLLHPNMTCGEPVSNELSIFQAGSHRVESRLDQCVVVMVFMRPAP